MTKRVVKVGLCGVTMKLAEYPHHFPVLEVQQTFYQPPGLATLKKWRATVPADFEFTVKAWQLITHSAMTSSTYRRLRRPLTADERLGTGGFRDTAIVREGWAATVACAQELRATAILFQCPASFRATADNAGAMRLFFARLERPTGVQLLWEPRGPWPADLTSDLCNELGLGHVVDPFVSQPQTTEPTYFRLHGIGGARHSYTDSELASLAARLPPVGETYVMFNNLPRVDDARRFRTLLDEGGPLG